MLTSIIQESLGIKNFYYTPPSLEDMQLYLTDNPADLETLREKNIEVVGNGHVNFVYLDKKFSTNRSVRLNFLGHDNVVVIGKPIADYSHLTLNAEFHSNYSKLIVSDLSSWDVQLAVISCDENQMIIWGKGSTSFGTAATLQFPNRILAVGDDCMAATGTFIRNSDMHGIYDLSSEKKINKEGDVIIQPHVWLGQNAFLLGDVFVGYGTVIGTQALAKGIMSPCSIYAGSPAKKIRENTSWEREPIPEISAETKKYLDFCKGILGDNSN